MHDRPTDHGRDQTIQEAAATLGISPNAVRMRIRRGTLSGYKGADGRWYVHSTDQVHTETDQATDRPTDQALSARMQLDMVRDEWLQPLIDQIGGLQRDLGRVEAERDEFRRQLEEEISRRRENQADQEAATRPWWKFWGNG